MASFDPGDPPLCFITAHCLAFGDEVLESQATISTDSRGPSQLKYIEFGLVAARKAKIDPGRILSFMSCNDLLGWTNSPRKAT
jgi:histidinol phosphatase-like PHP family hydrolase